ncbi:ABC transporter substrate-binding protein [Streptomyces odontomachi]|uniref:ABC transporter substrate-binding protein n=1 Tax=Streptomyces odontomachi TaxID=2944940 RepID=UPI00210A982E|nr:extracellular solute-binding protein [Streptomyces sp. ODS25]
MPKRRTVLAWGAASAAPAALTGCAESPGAVRMSAQTRRGPGQRVKLVFWTWIPIQNVVDVWNKAHPDIQVELQIVPASTSGGYQKMHAALQAGNAPDIAHVEYGILPEFMLVNGLTELSRYGADKLKSAYVDWQWKQCVFGGKVYALPQASGPMGYFYRKDVFDRLDLAVPATWDEFRRAAITIRKRGGGARICSFPPANAGWFASFAWQRGAHWIRADYPSDTWIVDVTSRESLEVADFWDGMIRDDLVTVMADSNSAWFNAVQRSKILSWVGAQWCDALLRVNTPSLKGRWRVADMPQWEAGRQTSSNWGGSSVAVLQGSRHPVEAMQFAHWLNTDPTSIDMLIAAGYGWPGARVDFHTTKLGKPDPFFGGQVYNEVFARSDRRVDTSWQWSPTNTQSIAHVSDAFGQAIAERSTLVGALRDSQPRMVDDLKAKGLKARAA